MLQVSLPAADLHVQGLVQAKSNKLWQKVLRVKAVEHLIVCADPLALRNFLHMALVGKDTGSATLTAMALVSTGSPFSFTGSPFAALTLVSFTALTALLSLSLVSFTALTALPSFWLTLCGLDLVALLVLGLLHSLDGLALLVLGRLYRLTLRGLDSLALLALGLLHRLTLGGLGLLVLALLQKPTLRGLPCPWSPSKAHRP